MCGQQHSFSTHERKFLWKCQSYIHTYINIHAHTHIYTYIYIYLLLLISMLWHRKTIFESKGDKLSSSAKCRIRTQRVSETQSPADWMPADKPNELSSIKLKDLNSRARSYDQQAFSTPDPTAIWHSHLALAIYIFVVDLISMLWHRQAIF